MDDPNLEESTTSEALQPHHRRHRSHSSGPRIIRRLRRRLRKVKWGSVLLVTLAVIVVLVVGSLVLAADSSNRVSSSLSSLQRVMDNLSSKPRTDLTLSDFDRLNTGVDDLVGSLTTARTQLGLFRFLGGLDSRLDTTLIQLDASVELGFAAQEMLNGLRPTLFFLVGGEDGGQSIAQISSGERMVELLQVGRGAFIRARDHLTAAREAIDRINPEELTTDLILSADHLDSYQIQLTQANNILVDAPELLTTAMGLEDQQSYLVLSQNSDELRPSGGYISTFGWMTIRNGRVTGYSYSPTTSTSPNPPPDSTADGVNVPNW